MVSKDFGFLCPMRKDSTAPPNFLRKECPNLFDQKGLELSSTESLDGTKRVSKKIERSLKVWSEWIELKETLAKFQAERGNKKYQKPSASTNQTQAQWSSAEKLGCR